MLCSIALHPARVNGQSKKMSVTEKSNIISKKYDVFLSSAPAELKKEYNTLLTPKAIEFLVNLTITFEDQITDLYNTRLGRQHNLKNKQIVPEFSKSGITESAWTIGPISDRLRNRHLDLGDVSPSDLNHFCTALRANIQGIQVDFDDGHCPTWKNQITGLYNVYQMVHGQLPNVPPLPEAPILMLRPRAWNMIEHNMSINGREVPGPLFDFALLMYHNGQILSKYNVGPSFYLSKVEGANEAKLWNEIFTWSEAKLGIPYGTIKACVLIENILSSFEMENILYELRDHAIGLNCGIWDYAASIINKFGSNRLYLLPDRNKYVNMSKHFLKRYMELVIRTCHRRNAHATGGMAADLLPEERNSEYESIVEKVCKSKLMEIRAGIDGFMVYDVKLVPYMNKLWQDYGGPFLNQINYLDLSTRISEEDLLTLPKGGVTEVGLRHNIVIAILFIYNWLKGKGHFAYNGLIEDSATAEISRAQVWQWIRHGAVLEDNNQIITRKIVQEYACEVLKDLENRYVADINERMHLTIALSLFLDLVNQREFPEFITTYLNNENIFRRLHTNL